MNHPILVFLGPTGSGKTTQATKIAEHYSLEKVTTGDIVRARIARGEMSDHDALSFTSGFLVYSDGISAMVNEAILGKLSDGLVLDGYPRTKSQLASLEGLLSEADCELTAIVYITISKEVARQRVLGRNRSDDSVESFENRFNQFIAHTEPMLEGLDDRSKLVRIDGTQSLTAITKEIVRQVDHLTI